MSILIAIARWILDRHKASPREQITQLRELHQPLIGDQPINGVLPIACASCIAGYDPQRNDLVHYMWPCPSAQILGHDPVPRVPPDPEIWMRTEPYDR